MKSFKRSAWRSGGENAKFFSIFAFLAALCQKNSGHEDRSQPRAGKGQRNRTRNAKMERQTAHLQPRACKPALPDLLMAIGTQLKARPPHIKKRLLRLLSIGTTRKLNHGSGRCKW